MSTSLRASWVFPVDRPPLKDGVVSFEGEQIVVVGTQPVGNSREVQDLGAVALLPGLVNAHTHLEFSDLARPFGTRGMPLVKWIRLVIAERGRRKEDPSHAIAAGLRESLHHGVTTIGDIAAANTADAYHDADVTGYLEVIGFSRARAASAMASIKAQLADFARVAGFRLGLSPHAPYTVSSDLLEQLIALASERDLPVAMHLAESADELEFLNRGGGVFQELLEQRSMWDDDAVPPRRRPLDYLRRLAGAPRALVIHGNYLEDDEHAFLAAHRDRMSLVYCPRTHAYFGHPPYPLAELLARGVSVTLGTDSRASSPDLDLFAEMRHIARTHTTIDPHEILRLGTLAGATALGRDNEVGSLTPGKLANMIAVPVSESQKSRPADILTELLSIEVAPSAVWFRGRKV